MNGLCHTLYTNSQHVSPGHSSDVTRCIYTYAHGCPIYNTSSPLSLASKAKLYAPLGITNALSSPIRTWGEVQSPIRTRWENIKRFSSRHICSHWLDMHQTNRFYMYVTRGSNLLVTKNVNSTPTHTKGVTSYCGCFLARLSGVLMSAASHSTVWPFPLVQCSKIFSPFVSRSLRYIFMNPNLYFHIWTRYPLANKMTYKSVGGT